VRTIIFLGLLVIMLSRVLLCQAAQVITPCLITSATMPDTCLHVYLGGRTVPMEVSIFENEKNLLILVYDHNAVIAGLMRPKAGVYSFYKVHIRDDNHEDLVGVSVSGPENKLTDLFILGFDATDGEIAPLPIIAKYQRPCFVSPALKLELDHGTLLVYLQCIRNKKIAIWWDSQQQIFVADNYPVGNGDSKH